MANEPFIVPLPFILNYYDQPEIYFLKLIIIATLLLILLIFLYPSKR